MSQDIPQPDFAGETVKIPVTCPACGVTSLIDYPVLVVTVALTKWNSMRLHSECHDAAWDGTALEISSIRAHLGALWIEFQRQALLI